MTRQNRNTQEALTHQPGIWRTQRRRGNGRGEEPERGEDGLGNPGNKLPGALRMPRLAAAKHCRTDVTPQPASHGRLREEELDGPFRVTGTGPRETTKTMSKHRIQLENSGKLINISSTGQIWAPAVACGSGIRSNSKVCQSSGSFYILSGQFASLPCKGLAELRACSKAASRGGSDNEEQEGGF